MGKARRKSAEFSGVSRRAYVDKMVRKDYHDFVFRGSETVRLVGAERREENAKRRAAYQAAMNEYNAALTRYRTLLARFVRTHGALESGLSPERRVALKFRVNHPSRPYPPFLPKWKDRHFDGQSFETYFKENAGDYERSYDRAFRDGGPDREKNIHTARGTMTQKVRRADDRRVLRLIKKGEADPDGVAFMTGKEQFWDCWW